MELVAAHPEWRERLAKNGHQLKNGLKLPGDDFVPGSIGAGSQILRREVQHDGHRGVQQQYCNTGMATVLAR